MASLSAKKKLILVKAETTYGVDPTPVGANAVLTSNAQINPLGGQQLPRNLDRPYLGNELQIQVGSIVNPQFDVEVQSSGAAGTDVAFGALLLGARMAATVTAATKVVYNPVSGSFSSFTSYYFWDGQKHPMLGGRADCVLKMDAQQIPHFSFNATGLYAAPASASPPTPDYSPYIAPLPVTKTNTQCTFFGITPTLKSFELDFGNQVQPRLLVGSESIQIPDRMPKGKILIEAPDLATKNFITTAVANQTGALQIIHGTAAGQIFQLDAAVVQAMHPSYSNDQETLMLGLDLSFIPTAGDDEYTFTFK